MNSIKRNYAVIAIALVMALIVCLAAFTSCHNTPKPPETPAPVGTPAQEGTPAPVGTPVQEGTPAPLGTPKPLIHKTQNLQIPENPDEVYTAEDVRIDDYLGCHDDVLYFLGSSPYEPDNPDSIQSNFLILSSPRTAQGGTLGVLADLGPAIECMAYSMHNGRVILDMCTGDSPILPMGGGIISVDTEGRIQVLKEYGDKMPLVSMYGEHILCVTMPQPGETEQIVESYNLSSGAWSRLFSLPLTCTDTDNGKVYTGTRLYCLGGVSNDGFWYAVMTLSSSAESGDAASEIRYYDAKSGDSSHVIDLHEEISGLTGDSAAGYCVVANREYIVYRSEQGAQTVTMPVRMHRQTPIRSIGDTGWLLYANLYDKHRDAVVFDLANSELTNYHASPKNEWAKVFFLNDTPDTILLLLTAEPADGAAASSGQRVIVFRI